MKYQLNQNQLEAILEESSVNFTPVIGKRFARARMHYLMKSQAEMAEVFGLTATIISNLEQGERPHRGVRVVDLLEAFGVLGAMYILKGLHEKDVFRRHPDGKDYWYHRHKVDGRRVRAERERPVKALHAFRKAEEFRLNEVQKMKKDLTDEASILEQKISLLREEYKKLCG